MDILITNRKLPSIHSESVLWSRSKASTYSYSEKGENAGNCQINKKKEKKKLRSSTNFTELMFCYMIQNLAV